jgi:hypothetical protein
MSRTPLAASAFATADATGKATAKVQPLRAFERWHITNTSVQNSSTVKIPTVKLYKGAGSGSNFFEGSYSGVFNSTNTPITLESGQVLMAVWENGDANASCTLTIEGETEI